MAETVYLIAVEPNSTYPIRHPNPTNDGWPIQSRVRDAVELIADGQPVKLHTDWDGVERARRIVAEVKS